jgi:hypothetical protein
MSAFTASVAMATLVGPLIIRERNRSTHPATTGGQARERTDSETEALVIMDQAFTDDAQLASEHGARQYARRTAEIRSIKMEPAPAGEQLIGTVTHYFGKPRVAIVEITNGELNVGDSIHILGNSSDFTQQVQSMELEHAPVDSAKVGDSVGIQVSERAREHDRVYRVNAA